MSVRARSIPKVHPPVPESDSVWYLLLQLGVPSPDHHPKHDHAVEFSAACRKISLVGKIMPIEASERYQPSQRYFFRFQRYKRDDRRAAFIAETILNATYVTCGPVGDANDDAAVLRIPRALIDRRLPIQLDDLITLERARDWPDRVLWFPHETIGSHTGFLQSKQEVAWRRVPIVLSNPSIAQALRYMRTSLQNFYVYPSQVDEIIDDPAATANTPSEETHLETALHNAFKVIEALVGDPPKDDRKLALKLKALNIDSEEPFGYGTPRPILQVIREFSRARDVKSAHGSTPKNAITVAEVLEFQACAAYLLDMSFNQFAA